MRPKMKLKLSAQKTRMRGWKNLLSYTPTSGGLQLTLVAPGFLSHSSCHFSPVLSSPVLASCQLLASMPQCQYAKPLKQAAA
jgi:hypothetical protein